MTTRTGLRLGAALAAALALANLVTGPAKADPRGQGYPGPYWNDGPGPYGHPYEGHPQEVPGHRGPPPPGPYMHGGRTWPVAQGDGWPHHEGRRIIVPVYRVRYYRQVVVVRPYGHLYPGYGYYRSDDDAYRWLAFTAITLKILDNLNEAQERAHEEAQAQATTAPVGDTIIWNQGGASGQVSVVRDGYTTSGRYCREFQQQVTIGGRTEEAYGTACMQPDGAWQVVSTDS